MNGSASTSRLPKLADGAPRPPKWFMNVPLSSTALFGCTLTL